MKLVRKAFKRRAAEGGSGGYVLRSLTALQENGYVRTEEEAKERQLRNPKQLALRQAALKELDEQRKADPAYKARKTAKKVASRNATAVRFVDSGRPLTPEIREKAQANKKACRFFFDLMAYEGDTPPGCTMGSKCRFLHSV
eukprot:TRINITY_DN36854_c0_g1_i1.p1 TRINITY_DN36854_c0_g1~~TRINITY_DN36854_c0_g1_i1.p1  ORF type:complete len:142 (-),score=47.55 TRINITY_DN36854_c0_g1_i1:19-444(-)